MVTAAQSRADPLHRLEVQLTIATVRASFPMRTGAWLLNVIIDEAIARPKRKENGLRRRSSRAWLSASPDILGEAAR